MNSGDTRPVQSRVATIGRGIGIGLTTLAAWLLVRSSSTDKSFVSGFEWSFVLIAVIFGAFQAFGLYRILKASPIPKGVPWGQGLRQALLKTGRTHERWWANHPWLMLLMTLAIVVFGAIAGGSRWAFYARP